MKKIILLSLVAAGSIAFAKPVAAQVQVSVNIGVQPDWGPSGYDYAENYYLPEAEAYYCVPRHQFVYFDRGDWVYSSTLPGRCNNFDLYAGYKVVMNERNPWYHFNEHRMQYAGYRYRHDQACIRDYGYGNRGYGYGRPGNGYGRDYDRGRDWDDRGRRFDREDRRRDYDEDRGRGRDDDHHGRGRGWAFGRRW